MNNTWAGFYLEDSSGSIIRNNTISNNSLYGMDLEYSNSNLIYNNYFNNSE